ncbi:Gx transporter family protein [Caproiciproducens galactitolivorans]|uniref:Heptaprenyl diphosphate synthase component I n=1 Tax=Caproiciproducens galactitolivorans TaxID=642589 RepID=A0A4Z0YCS6_9FIRM|nr:Gx transporter family protein [Caproiciproducens galactitolivorans]QEY33776.1 Gx transporter family protein [Caproiciproducens galactitolivorans]TGJ75646.1 heptaprenyl diphosphate synthase component I [Caproiciproducens galactitolivorans]
MNHTTNLNLSPRTRSIAFNGLLTALALVLSAIELTLPPLPLLPPGAKLGLSNIVTMYATGAVGLGPALCIALIKGLFAGVTRGFTAMLMSLSGGLLSTLVMWLLLRVNGSPFGLIGLGVAGALSHNAAQLFVAFLLTTPAVLYYLPWLILFGVLSGIVTGLVLRVMMPLLNKFTID